MIQSLKLPNSYTALARTLFPLCAILLCVSTVYILNVRTLPGGPDLCRIWRERTSEKPVEEKQWWEWACQLESEWDKGNEYACRDERGVGNYRVCFDPIYKPSPPCLVYSFGIDYDFRFDDEMAKLGCEVYSFDPSMSTGDHQRSERVHFYQLGLGASNKKVFSPKLDGYTAEGKSQWRIMTLKEIKKMLGHQDRTLDVLKMDIETYEWKVVQGLLEDGSLKNVKQFLLEWHIFGNEPMRTDFPAMYQNYMQLKKEGWRQFYTLKGGRVHTSQFFNSQMDNGLVNTAFNDKH